MENEPVWHYRSPNKEEYQKAVAELNQKNKFLSFNSKVKNKVLVLGSTGFIGKKFNGFFGK